MKKSSTSNYHPSKIKSKKSRSSVLKFIFSFWVIFFIGIIGVLIFFFATAKGWLGTLPSTEDIENPSMEVGSEVYDAHGELLGKFFSENRTLVTYKQLPQNLVNALIAKEDIRFREHSGIDGKSFLRAVSLLGRKGGGSTISQQLAKLLFTGRSAKNKLQRLRQKLLEWVLAVELEKRYTKEEIITMYFNKFDFLFNAKGIETAAQTYFNKSTSELDLGECATLVGMLKNPSLYNPKIHPEKAQKQRNLILFQMKKYEFIDSPTYEKALIKLIKINFKLQKQNFGLLTYYTEFLRKEVQQALDEYEEKTDQTINLYSGGLKIYTTIDARMQRHAEAAVKKHLNTLQLLFNASQKSNKTAPFSDISVKKRERIFLAAMRRTQHYQNLKQKKMTEAEIIAAFKQPQLLKIFTWDGDKDSLMSPWDFIGYQKSIIQTGMLSMEPSTGYIKAWVGGIDFDHFQYDHVAQTRRQVGSAFKPIVYATAINQLHYNPCTSISNKRFTAGKWSPRNADGKYGGSLTLKEALSRSVNTISVRLISMTTPRPVINLAKEMGIYSPIPENLSIALGSADLTPYEMTGAFNTFTNYGVYVKPTLLIRIEDKYGKVLKEHTPMSREVLGEETAYIMLKLMQGVVNNGTARRIRRYGITGEVAGKTGTTNEHADGWFVGLVPNLTTTVWVGWEDRFAHFQNLRLGQGASMALPIWAYYMSNVYRDKNLGYQQSEIFSKPTNISFQWNDCGSYGYDSLFEDGENQKNSIPKKNPSTNIDHKLNKKSKVNYDD
ncbi:MAG: transglycosylase domain-containing protein [Flavobacteriales bacterium]